MASEPSRLAARRLPLFASLHSGHAQNTDRRSDGERWENLRLALTDEEDGSDHAGSHEQNAQRYVADVEFATHECNLVNQL